MPQPKISEQELEQKLDEIAKQVPPNPGEKTRIFSAPGRKDLPYYNIHLPDGSENKSGKTSEQELLKEWEKINQETFKPGWDKGIRITPEKPDPARMSFQKSYSWFVAVAFVAGVICCLVSLHPKQGTGPRQCRRA